MQKPKLTHATACKKTNGDAHVTHWFQKLSCGATQFCRLEFGLEIAKLSPSGNRERSMVRELHLLTAGFVFAFLGAIVIGLF